MISFTDAMTGNIGTEDKIGMEGRGPLYKKDIGPGQKV